VARRIRTAKTLAQRILDLDYFKKPHPLRRWRWLLSVAAPVAGLLWLVAAGVSGWQKPYTSGPLSRSHAFIGGRCQVCHATTLGFFSKKVRDEACAACHDGPQHHASQLYTPTCGSCHGEHTGAAQLSLVADKACTQCHSDLRVRQGKAPFLPVSGFPGGHPQFRPLRPGNGDPGTVKLNHLVHLKKDLKGPSGPVQMDCSDCHRPPAWAGESWPYSVAGLQAAQASAPNSAEAGPEENSRAFMAPISYPKHCAACHVLNFDPRFTESAPHDKPQVVHDFLVKKFTDYLAAHPDAWHDDTPWVQRTPREELPAPARTPQEWLVHRVGESERLLFHMTCKQCHSPDFSAGPLPSVPPARITARWLPHSDFDHEAHRALDCVACHAQTPKSQDTADVLIPGIATCQQCHRSMNPMRDDAADSRCSECHTYHDWSKEKRTKGRYTLPGLSQAQPEGAPRTQPASLLP
jgi:ssDNA-binding Zn-finger/Zn-ribbon topoisomerase 1